jgi:hypothetical protein
MWRTETAQKALKGQKRIKKIIMEELGNQSPPHDEETITTNRSYSERQKSENVSDDDVYDQTLATILHETDNFEYVLLFKG